jgi:hypothetical protein
MKKLVLLVVGIAVTFVASNANALEVITSTAMEAKQKLIIQEYNNKLASYRAMLADMDREIQNFESSTGVKTFVVGQKLTEPEMQQYITYQKMLLDRDVSQKILDEAEKNKPELKSLKLVPSFQINTNNTTANYVPAIEGQGAFKIGSWLGDDIMTQVVFSLKPNPPNGDKKEVAQSINVNTGVFSTNIGINYGHFWIDSANVNGPVGIEVRAGNQISYQRASINTVNQATQVVTEEVSDFGIMTPELKLSMWLKYMLIGYKFSHNLAFGKNTELKNEVDKSINHKIYSAIRFDALSGKNNQDPFYVELTYTSGKNEFNNGTFGVAFSKEISW